MTISRCISFMLKPRLTNSAASQSSSFGLRRMTAQLAEIARGLLQTFAEMPLPKAIDRDAGEQRIVGRRQPVGKRLDPAFAKIDIRRGERPAGLHLMVHFGPFGIAAGEDVALVQLLLVVDFHGPKGGNAEPPSAGRRPGSSLLLQILVLLALGRRHDRQKLSVSMRKIGK